MSLNGTDTYLILNYSPSAVSVSTRDTSYLIPGGRFNAPASFPLTLNEIRYINNVSKAFKCGLLFFEDDIAEEMYAELHIPDWRMILRDGQIEDILRDPTVDGLERILAITDQLYFERVYGVYVGMKSVGIPISSKVEGLLTTRRKELARGKITTDLSVRQIKPAEDADAKIKALEEQVAKLAALLTTQPAAPSTESQPAETVPAVVDEPATTQSEVRSTESKPAKTVPAVVDESAKEVTPARKPRQTKNSKGG